MTNADRIKRALNLAISIQPRSAAAVLCAWACGYRRFNQIQRETKLGNSTLSNAIRTLVDKGVLRRHRSGYLEAGAGFWPATNDDTGHNNLHRAGHDRLAGAHGRVSEDESMRITWHQIELHQQDTAEAEHCCYVLTAFTPGCRRFDDIRQATGLSPTAVSNALRTLQKKGLLARRPDGDYEFGPFFWLDRYPEDPQDTYHSFVRGCWGVSASLRELYPQGPPDGPSPPWFQDYSSQNINSAN